MKLFRAIQVAGLASATLLTSTPSLAYDVYDMPGTAKFEGHAFQLRFPSRTSAEKDYMCGGGCNAYQGDDDMYNNTFIAIENETVSAGASVADCYGTNDSATLDENDEVDTAGAAERLWVHLHAPTGNGVQVGVNNTKVNNDIVFLNDDFPLCTDAEGRITSGRLTFCTQVPINTCNHMSFDEGIQLNFILGPSNAVQPNPTQISTAIAQHNNGQKPTATGYDGGWTWASTAFMAYLTCDIGTQCGRVDKAVPVPAFAAASLGLGLLGVTFLTARRRTIK